MRHTDDVNVRFSTRPRRSRRNQEVNARDFDFADNICQVYNRIIGTQHQLDRLTNTACEVGLTINTEKTEYVAINVTNSEANITSNNVPIKRVQDCKYLLDRFDGDRCKDQEGNGMGSILGARANVEVQSSD